MSEKEKLLTNIQNISNSAMIDYAYTEEQHNFREGRLHHSIKVFISIEECSSISEVREKLKFVMNFFNLHTVKKDFFQDSDLIFQTDKDKNDVYFKIWIGLKAKVGLKILSESFKCEMQKTEKQVSHTMTSVSCPARH